MPDKCVYARLLLGTKHALVLILPIRHKLMPGASHHFASALSRRRETDPSQDHIATDLQFEACADSSVELLSSNFDQPA